VNRQTHAGGAGKVTVRSFLEAGGSRLSMELVAGDAGLERPITEAALNRPGLALSGFFKYFPFRRIQVIGLAEQAYLSELSPKERRARLKEFFSAHIPCVVITRHKSLPEGVLELAARMRVPVLRTKMITKDFVNAATIVMETLITPRVSVQGTMVEIMGVGMLIEGTPGIGKSETALALIQRGYALVADDVTCLRRDSTGAVIGSPPDVTRYHMEIRGLGIIHVPSLYGVSSVRSEKQLDLVVTLCSMETAREHSTDAEPLTKEFLGVPVPRIFIPVAPGRELANVVETAALNEKLKRLGHDAEKELDLKLMRILSGADSGE
jgi:HPr kinase/phosphorylase